MTTDEMGGLKMNDGYKFEYKVDEGTHTISIRIGPDRRLPGVPGKAHSIRIGAEYKGVYDDCTLVLDKYAYNDRWCLSAYSRTNGPVARLTTNLSDCKIGAGDAFIDENNCPGAARFLVDNGFAEDMCRSEKSGYCEYPLVRLNIPKIIQFMDR